VKRAVCTFHGAMIARWLIRGDGGSVVINGHRPGGWKGVKMDEQMDERSLEIVSSEIEEEGLDSWLRARFGRLVEDAGRATFGPDFQPDAVMTKHLTADLAQLVADEIRAYERTPVA
jgi:hypothetical protein